MQYTEKELNKLIEDVEKEFSAFLTKSEAVDSAATLAKSEDGDKKDEKPESKESKESSKEESDKPAEAPKSEEAPAAEEEVPAAEEAAEAASPVEGEAHGYDEEDMAHLDAMYASMSKAELIAHHDAVRKALDAKTAEEAPAPDAAAVPAEAAPEAAPADAAPAEMTKSEIPAEVELLKTELGAEKAKSDDLKKSLDAVTEILTKLVKKTAPAGKAITSLDVIQKSETTAEEKSLTKSEITAVLATKAADPSLAKSDRDAINAFYLNGGSMDKIRHLLK